MIAKIINCIKKSIRGLLDKSPYIIKIVIFIFPLCFSQITNAINNSDIQNIESILKNKFEAIESTHFLRRLEKEQYQEVITTIKQNYNKEFTTLKINEFKKRLKVAMVTLIYTTALSSIFYSEGSHVTMAVTMACIIIIIDIVLSVHNGPNNIVADHPEILTNIIEKYDICGKKILKDLSASGAEYTVAMLYMDWLLPLILSLSFIYSSPCSSTTMLVVVGFVAMVTYNVSQRTPLHTYEFIQKETIFEKLLLASMPTFIYKGNLLASINDSFIERFYKWMSWTNKNNNFLNYLIYTNDSLYQRHGNLLYNKEFNLSFALIAKQQAFPASFLSSIYKENGAFFIEIKNDVSATRDKHKSLAVISTDSVIYIMTAVTPRVSEVLDKISIEKENKYANSISQTHRNYQNIIITKIPKSNNNGNLHNVLSEILDYLCYRCENISLYQIVR